MKLGLTFKGASLHDIIAMTSSIPGDFEYLSGTENDTHHMTISNAHEGTMFALKRHGQDFAVLNDDCSICNYADSVSPEPAYVAA